MEFILKVAAGVALAPVIGVLLLLILWGGGLLIGWVAVAFFQFWGGIFNSVSKVPDAILDAASPRRKKP